MKNLRLIGLLMLVCPIFSWGQVVTNPFFPSASDFVTITYDATQGNQALVGVSPVYIHCGVITNYSDDLSDWQHVMGSWGTANSSFLMTSLGDDLYEFSFQIDEYFNLLPDETVSHLAFVFRDADGDVVGRAINGDDIYSPVFDDTFAAGFVSPNSGALIFASNSEFEIIGAASSLADFEITYDGSVVSSASNSISTTLNFVAQDYGVGVHQFLLEVDYEGELINDTLTLIVQPPTEFVTAPSGIIDGINFTGDEAVTFRLFAPFKDFVYVIGDFNNWEYSLDYMMHKDPANGRFWLTVENLDPSVEYRFQYSIDFDFLKVADVYSEKVLDKYNDPYIPENNYPDLIEYPVSVTNGHVSVFQINDSEEHVWEDEGYESPSKEKLIIYELLIRDFLATQSYEDLTDTLDYLEYIGVNAIELMPINEFDGNNSWGYNPAFYLAPDKMYGGKNQLKNFVDNCHQRGIAVLMDIALNHSFGNNPQVKMYFDSQAGEWGQPTAENPWFNETPTHDFNVGYDYNHESVFTKAFCKRVLKHWVEEYHIDGYRMDLSKGFTQNVTIGDIDAWSSYDQSRIDILTDYANYVWDSYPDTYFVLEHFGHNSEEMTLSNNGFMLWGNLHSDYSDAAMGWGGNLSWGVHTSRGWNDAHLVTYMESHDEERMMYNNIHFGNSVGDYFIQMSNTALARQELAFAFLIPIPGPKMMWQFGELGYDYTIEYCENGSTDPDCKTDPKPIRWDYVINPNRVKLLKVVKALNELKTDHEVFSTMDFSYDLSSNGKKINLYSSNENVCIIGNFGMVDMQVSPSFAHTGTWYNYFEGGTIDVADVNSPITLNPGEYRLYTDFQLPLPDLSGSLDMGVNGYANSTGKIIVYPNPASSELYISSDSEIISYSIYDLQGKQILQEKASTTTIAINHLTEGMYLLEVVTENSSHLQKIMVHE